MTTSSSHRSRISSRRLLAERIEELGLNDSFELPAWATVTLMAGVAGFIWAKLGSLAGLVGTAAAVGVVLLRNSVTPGGKLAALRQKRAGESICGFARSFDRKATDALVIRAVYSRTQVWAGAPGLPVRADDGFSTVLDLDGEDIDDLAAEVAEITRRPLAGMEHNPYFGKVFTPADLVSFFMRQPVAA